MKTNPAARGILKIRFIALCLAVAGMAGLGFTLGSASAVRVGQATVAQNPGPQPPAMNLGELMAGAR